MSHDHHEHSEMPTVTSTSLLERIRVRDGDAWERFVTLYCPLVYDLCRRSGLQAEDANDVAQEVLQSVLMAIGTFKKEQPGDSFRGWLYRIVQNKIRDHFRRSGKQPHVVGGSDFQGKLDRLPEELSDETVSCMTSGDPVLMRVLELIRPEFQPQTWSAFWRLTVEGHRAADIAADLGMKTNAVRQAKFRVRLRLRAEFGELIDWPNENLRDAE